MSEPPEAIDVPSSSSGIASFEADRMSANMVSPRPPLSVSDWRWAESNLGGSAVTLASTWTVEETLVCSALVDRNRRGAIYKLEGSSALLLERIGNPSKILDPLYM